MRLRVVIGFKKIDLMPMMTCPVARSTYHNLIFKTPKKMPSADGPLLGIFSVFKGNMIRLKPISAHLRSQKDGT